MFLLLWAMNHQHKYKGEKEPRFLTYSIGSDCVRGFLIAKGLEKMRRKENWEWGDTKKRNRFQKRTQKKCRKKKFGGLG